MEFIRIDYIKKKPRVCKPSVTSEFVQLRNILKRISQEDRPDGFDFIRIDYVKPKRRGRRYIPSRSLYKGSSRRIGLRNCSKVEDEVKSSVNQYEQLETYGNKVSVQPECALTSTDNGWMFIKINYSIPKRPIFQPKSVQCNCGKRKCTGCILYCDNGESCDCGPNCLNSGKGFFRIDYKK